MGLGKTLTAISVIWAIIRSNRSAAGRGGGCKAVVVCPSSLVSQWEKEVIKWLHVKLNKPLVLRGGEEVQKIEQTIQTFVVGHWSMSPLLICSYEMFRKYSNKINMSKANLLVCDEAHR